MPGALNLPTNISLQTGSTTESPDLKGQPEASDAGKQASGFASVMKSISPGTINIGKPLPEDGLVMAENQQQQVQNDALQQVTEST
ncbi:MAG: hypothetical protein EBW40_11300, partial [Gammaproteobacteria bacterium]|nr:hypothetical protein [Gammaproteobacteria bacterium]